MLRFEGRPRPPLVPPPVAGETLSGWVASLAGLYGLTVKGLLNGMGVTAPARVRWLDLAPSPRVLAALSNETGVGVAFMRECMTFRGLGPELVPTVLVGAPVCRRCAAEAQPAERKVEHLREIAPWRFACDRHKPRVSLEEMDWRLDQDAMLRDVGRFSARLEAAAFREPSRPFPPVARSTADCIRLVRALNERIRFRVHSGSAGGPVFVVQETPPGAEEVLAPSRRNRLALTAWYAWHLMSDPEGALRWRTRSAPDGARVLAMLLAGFLPGEQMIAVRLDVAALLGKPARAPPSVGDAADEMRTWMLALGLPEDRPRRSPFEYPDFGRRFVPAFYLPGATLAALCVATRLRPSVRPPVPRARQMATPEPPRLPSPSPEALAPYLALVAAARAELAREAGNETVRPREVARRAFRLLRQTARPIAPSWPGTGGR
ncbi:MAG: TniQ family protein [Acetobacteraceae bacterium]|nr:TniQ family protein [Acetobacteraceae bacterium]